MDDVLSLGTDVAPWQIKDFSVTLRTQITKAARQQDCTLAEWLHGHFQRHGIDGQQFEPVKLALVGPATTSRPAPVNGASPADTLATVAAAIGALANTRGVPRATRQAVNETATLILLDARQRLMEHVHPIVLAPPT